jgi:uncharacterized protein (DUF427 family)
MPGRMPGTRAPVNGGGSLRCRGNSALAGGDAGYRVGMRAVWNGVTLAQSDRTVVVEGNHYFPREALNDEFVTPSRHHSICPWKGRASYFDVHAAGETNPNAAWFYPRPLPTARRVRDRVAFWKGVEVVP